MSDPDGTKCSRCGASLPADGSADLCPRCRLSDARGARSEDSSDSLSSPGEAHHELSLDSLIAAIGATGQQPADADAHHYILAAATMALREQEAGRALSDADIHYYGGIALAAQKKLEQAVGEFAAALRLRPDFAKAHNDLGNALRDQGKRDEAIAEFRTAILLDPDFGHPHYNLGVMLAASGNLDAAIAEFRAAIRVNPDFAIGHNNLGVALKKQGKADEAIAEFRTAIRLQPDDAQAHSNLGTALQDQGIPEEAVTAYRTAIRLRPDEAEDHINLGTALFEQGKLEEAVAAYREAIRLQPDAAAAHSNLGCALRDQGKLEEAIAVHREAVRLEPAVAAAHNGLAWALVVSPKRPRRDYEEGLRHARRGVELLPNEAKVANTLALAEYRSSHWLESIAASERSMALQSGGNANDWFLLAMAHRQKGDKDEACKWFDKAVARTKELGPKNADSRRFWEEAAELLGQPGPDADGAEPPAEASR